MSTTSTARYDSHAEWFIDYSNAWRSAATDYLPEDLSGQRVLDLACGFGQLSRPLADRGAAVTGVDLAGRLIAQAQHEETEKPRGISYHTGSATDTDWWDGETYDGVVCNMALMDIDDLDAALATVRSVLSPGGWFTATLFHPCYPGNPQEPTSLPSWPPDRGYDAEGWWTTGQTGVRGHVGAHHRMLSSYLNAIVAAGLQPTAFAERGSPLPSLFVVTATRS